jgi:hypothetical protein
VGLGFFITFFSCDTRGPVALLAIVTTDIITTRFPLSYSSRVLDTALAARIVTARVGTRTIADLHTSHPLLISEEKTPTILLWLKRPLPLLDGAEMINDFLNRERVQIEQCLHRDYHLLKFVGDSVQHPLDDHLVGDVITEHKELTYHRFEL